MSERASVRRDGRRQPSGHDHARELAATRIDEPLAPADERWLAGHLRGCGTCAAVAREYEANRRLLRAQPAPIPPRDLWADTSARLDAAASRSRARGLGRSTGPLGALGAVLVVAVVVGASVLNGGVASVASPSGDAGVASVGPVTALASPIRVDRQVPLLHPASNGTLGYAVANVDQVCVDAPSRCQAATNPGGAIVLNERPKSVIQSPNGHQLALVVEGGDGGGIVIVPAPSSGTVPASPSGAPAGSTTVGPSSAPPSPSPSSTASSQPSSSPTDTTRSPSAPASASPDRSPSASPTPAHSGEPSGEPSAPASVEPSVSASPQVTPPVASPTPSPVLAQALSIAADVAVVGDSAAYSASGTWFAFSGRPADGSGGPDVYVWRVGDLSARPITTDHHSVFSAWVGDNVLGSRADLHDGSEASEARSVSFLEDPATGASRVLAGDGIWRPVVDPSGRLAVYWSGSVQIDPATREWRPSHGTLVLARWDPAQLAGPVAAPSASARSSDGSASASPATPLALIAGAPIRDWDARWDETGRYLAVWLADPTSDDGRLTLHTVDAASGALDPGGPAFADAPARSGFAIGDGRVAWVSPDANGSVVRVYAWTGAKGGTAETQVQPDDTVVVR